MPVSTQGKRILVLGRESASILDLVRSAGFLLVEDSPDVVVTYGGDGLLLHSEREWPGVPKLPLRNSRHGKKCEPRTVQEALDRLAKGELLAVRQAKVRADVRGEVRVGLNDIIVHNSRPTATVRCHVEVDGRRFGGEVVGDGVVVATPFGSTAYYRSITRSVFHAGLGLAFNNSTEPVDHTVLPESAEIRIAITRGPALVAADNDPHPLTLEKGDEVLIRRHDKDAVILRSADD